MQGVAESGQAILSSTERRLEMASHNVANASTPGFKKQVSFSKVLAAEQSDANSLNIERAAQLTQADMSQGKLRKTDNPLDVAISGAGFFQVRAGEELLYTRQGQFRLMEDGSLVTPQGYVLQGDGGDIILQSASAEILDDGRILEDGLPTSRIAIFAPAEGADLDALSGSLFAARNDDLEILDTPLLRQGYVEGSNVSMTDEMVAMMAAVREAETGSRIIQVYDELLGRALSTFGQR